MYVNFSSKYHYYQAKPLQALRERLDLVQPQQQPQLLPLAGPPIIIREEKHVPLACSARGDVPTSAQSHQPHSYHTRAGGAANHSSFDYLRCAAGCNSSSCGFHKLQHRIDNAVGADGAISGLFIVRPLELMSALFPGARGPLDYAFPVAPTDLTHII